MPAIWSSSERPTSVRMVWVNGVRHAVLTQDDPILNSKDFRRRFQTSSVKEKNSSFKTYDVSCQRDCYFDGSLVKVRLIVEKGPFGKNEKISGSLFRRQSAPICSRIRRNLLDGNASTGNIQSEDYISSRNFDQDTKYSDLPQINTFLERVSHWLALSGKIRDFQLKEYLQHELNQKEPFSGNEELWNGTSFKVIVPSQFLTQRKRNCSDAVNFYDRQTKEQKSSQEQLDEQEKYAANNLKEVARSVEMWNSPGKPQLHIFMPNFKCFENYWMSSQESLFSD